MLGEPELRCGVYTIKRLVPESELSANLRRQQLLIYETKRLVLTRLIGETFEDNFLEYLLNTSTASLIFMKAKILTQLKHPEIQMLSLNMFLIR